VPSAGSLETFLRIAPRSPQERTLRLLIELGAQVVGAAEGSLLTYDRRRHDLVFALTVGDRLSQQQLKHKRVPIGEGITGLAALTREVQIGAPTWKGFAMAARGAGQKPRAGRGKHIDKSATVLAAPMLVEDQLIGVLTAVSFDRKHRFTRDNGVLYGRMAAVAALIVHQRALLEGGSARGRAPSSAEAEAIATIGRISLRRPAALRTVAEVLLKVEALLDPSTER
jgi:hypothetical protein